jgi:excisionase family DNA binding protein
VTYGVTDRAPLRPKAHRHSHPLLTVGGERDNPVPASPSTPSVRSVTFPFAALVLQELEQSEAFSGIAPDNGARLLSVREVAQRLGICRATVYKLVAQGRCRSVRIGNVIRIQLSVLTKSAK